MRLLDNVSSRDIRKKRIFLKATMPALVEKEIKHLEKVAEDMKAKGWMDKYEAVIAELEILKK